MENTEQEHVLPHQPAGHDGVRSAGTQEDARQSVVHVLPAVGHVQLLQLPADGRHARLTQPADNGQGGAAVRPHSRNDVSDRFKKNETNTPYVMYTFNPRTAFISPQ